MSKEIQTIDDKEIIQDNLKKEKSEEISKPENDLDPMNKYTEQLDRKKELAEQIYHAENEVKNNHDEINKIRESMGLPLNSDFDTASDSYLENLREQEQGIEDEIENEERDLLNVPDNKGEDSKTMKTRAENMEVKSEKDIKKLEKEAREEFVQEFIKSTLEKMKEDFQSFLYESENANEAEKLIEQKTTTEITNKAKDFIENGSNPNIGFEAEITGAKFDNSKGKRVQYVTEFNITFKDSNFTEVNGREDEQGLIDSQTQTEMESAEKRDDLEEVKK